MFQKLLIIMLGCILTTAYAADVTDVCQSGSQTQISNQANLIKNPSFELDEQGVPTDWQLIKGQPNQLNVDDTAQEGSVLVMAPSGDISVALTQTLTLKPKTKYTVSVCVKGRSDAPPTVMVDGGVQRMKTQSYLEPHSGDDVWTLYRYVFYTTSGPVVLKMSGYHNKEGITQSFKMPMIVEGSLPAPIPSLPNTGDNLVLNGDFSGGTTSWVFDTDSKITKQTCDAGRCYAELTASPDFSARVSQSLAFALSPQTTYHLTAKVKTEGNDVVGRVFATIRGEDPAPKEGSFTTGGQWQELSYTFTTNDDASNVKIMLESYKQATTGHVDITDVKLISSGGEGYPQGDTKVEETTQPLIEDFGAYQTGQTLNTSEWLLPNKAWGGDNHGVLGKNVQFASTDADGQFLRMKVYGSQAEADRIREGAAIATKKYFASGVYIVCARMPRHEGVVSAFWPFHYIGYKSTEKEYWDEPNPIRNTEIDWELPTSNKDNTSPVTYALARLNNWGGQFGGEGGNDSERVDLLPYNDGKLVNEDNQFHQYGIVWFAGKDNADGTREPGYVKWTFNKDCMAHPAEQMTSPVYSSLQVVLNTQGQDRTAGESYGQDNIPYRAARFWIGAWFPGSPDRPYHAGGKTYWGWGGTPDFNEDHLDIKWVAIYPWKATALSPEANRDKWEAETAPDAGNWSIAADYPKVGGTTDGGDTGGGDGTDTGDGSDPDEPVSNGKVSAQFDATFPEDKEVTINWVDEATKATKSKVLSKSGEGFKFTPMIGSQVFVDGNVCWDNKGDSVRSEVSGIFIAVQKTWIKCRFQ